MSVPYTFSTATGSLPLSQLDTNFSTAITIGNTAVVLGDTITTVNNLSLANVAITSVSTQFPNGYLANSNVIVGTTTLTLGSTVTSINGLSLSNVTISSGNVTISNVTTTNVTATTANVTTANVGTLVVIGDASVGGNVTITGNVSAAKGTFTSANVSGTANVQVIAVTQNATVAGNATVTGNVSASNGTFTSANVSGTANVSTLAVVSNVTIGGNATVTGNVSMNVATITTANVTTTNTSSLVVTGNQTFVGTGNRITGDFSNATVASRIMFQTVTANTGSQVGILPNGTALGTFFNAYANSDPTNTSFAQFGTTAGTEVRVASSISGTGTYLPMTVYTGGSERARIDTSGNVLIGSSTANAKLYSYATTGTTTTLGRFEAAIGSYTGTSLIAANTLANASTYNLFSCITDSDGDGGGPFTQFLVRGDGNVGIGTSSPNASAILDAQSTTKGVRFPNMTTTQKNAISSPAAGLVVFDTTLSKLAVYSGSAWQTITSV